MGKKIGKVGIKITIITAIIVAINIFMDGMWILGIPDIEDVQAVQITDRRYSDEAKEFTDEESIQLAVQLSCFLKYKPLRKLQNDFEPVVTLTYLLKDGTQRSLSADENTVWWKGKAYALKQEEIFLNLCEGIFFFGEAVEVE